MTDRHKGYVVTLDSNLRSDDSQPIIDAIKLIKGVVTVEPILSDHFEEQCIRSRVVNELTHAVITVIRDTVMGKRLP